MNSGARPAPQTLQQINISNAKNFHFGNSYNIFARTPSTDSATATNKPATTETRKVTPEMKAMSRSLDVLDLDAMDVIATHLDARWKELARRLGFSDGQIHQFYEDHHVRGVKEVIFQFLLEWKQNEDPTLGKTVKILWKYKFDEVIYKLVDDYWVPKHKDKVEEEHV